MSAKSSRPADDSRKTAASGLKAFAEAMAESSRKQTEAKKAELTQDDESKTSEPEDLNILPMPNYQTIAENYMQWTWLVGLRIRVYGRLYTQFTEINDNDEKDHTEHWNAGDYSVELYDSQKPDSVESTSGVEILYNPDVAKDLGKALLSASNYVNIWKDHVGYYMEREFLNR